MNILNIDAINTYSPYPVWNKGDEYLFMTDNGIEYSVSFDDEDNFEYISLIVMNSHPKLAEISKAFDHIVKMFNDNK